MSALVYNDRIIRSRWCECGEPASWCDCASRAAKAEAEERRYRHFRRMDIIERGRAQLRRRTHVLLRMTSVRFDRLFETLGQLEANHVR